MAGDETQIILNTLSAAKPWDVYMGAGGITQLSMTVGLLALAIAFALAVIRRASGGRRSGLLQGTGFTGLIAGMLGAVWSGFNTWMAAQYSHVSHFDIILPSLIETAYALLFGVLAWLVAAIGNAGAKRG